MLFGPLFSHDLVPYRNKGSTHSIFKTIFSVEPSNKANTVCIQLVRPCTSSEHVQDSNVFFHKMERIINYPLLLPYLRIKPKTESQRGKKMIPYLRLEILKNYPSDAYSPTLCFISLKRGHWVFAWRRAQGFTSWSVQLDSPGTVLTVGGWIRPWRQK